MTIGSGAITGCMFTNFPEEYKGIGDLIEWGLNNSSEEDFSLTWDDYSIQFNLWKKALDQYCQDPNHDKELAMTIGKYFIKIKKVLDAKQPKE
jgi:hypothetical protein